MPDMHKPMSKGKLDILIGKTGGPSPDEPPMDDVGGADEGSLQDVIDELEQKALPAADDTKRGKIEQAINLLKQCLEGEETAPAPEAAAPPMPPAPAA